MKHVTWNSSLKYQIIVKYIITENFIDIKPGVPNVLIRVKKFSGHNVIHWDLVESDSLSYDIINLHYFSLPTQVVYALAEKSFSKAEKVITFSFRICTDDSCTLRSRTFISNIMSRCL